VPKGSPLCANCGKKTTEVARATRRRSPLQTVVLGYCPGCGEYTDTTGTTGRRFTSYAGWSKLMGEEGFKVRFTKQNRR